MNSDCFSAKQENPQQQKAKPIKLKQLQAEEMPENFSPKLEIQSLKKPNYLPERQNRKVKSFNHFYLPTEPERENLQNLAKPRNQDFQR